MKTSTTSLGNISSNWGFVYATPTHPPKKIQSFQILPFHHVLSPALPLSSFFFSNPDQKTQKINCWRNISTIAPVTRHSVGSTTPLANQCTRVRTNHTFCKAHFPFLSRKLSHCSAAFSCLFDANELFELCRVCCQVPLLSRPVEKSM